MNNSVPGSLHIANDVIADIAGYTALEGYGVVGMAGPLLKDGIATLLPTHKLRKGVEVADTDTGVRVDLFIVVEHGVAIAAVSRNLEEHVAFVLKDMTGVTVDDVVVHVQGVKVRDAK